MTKDELESAVASALEYKNEDLFYGEYHVPYYRLMTLLGRKEEGLMVELGVHRGMGSYSMAMSKNQVIGIDHTKQPDLEKVISLFPNFTFLERDSNPPPGEITTQGECISVLHIDTEHSYSMAECEFNVYKPFLKKGAVVLFDDVHAMEDDVKRFVDTLPYFKIHEDGLHPVCGYSVVLYE